MGFIALIVAHEYAHQLQDALMQGSDYAAATTATTKCYELEADVLAGVWFGSLLSWESDNLSPALAVLWRLGDLDFANPDSHGTPPERANAAAAGIQYYRGLGEGKPVELKAIRTKLCTSYVPRLHAAAHSADVKGAVIARLVRASDNLSIGTAKLTETYDLIRPVLTPFDVHVGDELGNINDLELGPPGSDSWNARADAAEAVYRLLRASKRLSENGHDISSVSVATLPTEDRNAASSLLHHAAEKLGYGIIDLKQ
jgi:hypothetical protein